MKSTAIPSLAAALAALAACAPGGPVGGHPTAADPGAPPPPVAYGGRLVRIGAQAPGYTGPGLREPGCLARALAHRPDAAGVDGEVRFAVLMDGSVSSFSYRTPVTPAQDAAIQAAVASCRWYPAVGPSGAPISSWVLQPLKVRGAAAP